MLTPHTYTSTRDQVLFSLYLVKLHKRMYNNMLKLGQVNFLVSLLAIPPLLLRKECFNLSTKGEAQKKKRVDTGNKVKIALKIGSDGLTVVCETKWSETKWNETK